MLREKPETFCRAWSWVREIWHRKEEKKERNFGAPGEKDQRRYPSRRAFLRLTCKEENRSQASRILGRKRGTVRDNQAHRIYKGILEMRCNVLRVQYS